MDRAKNRILDQYSEIHHIIPRCIGGSDDENNLVNLTPEEHFVAHQLLVKIYPKNSSLKHAAYMMTVSSSKTVRNNKLFGWLRKQHAKAMSDNLKGKPMPKNVKDALLKANIGRPVSQETRKKMSDKIKGKKRKPNTPEHNARIAASRLGKKFPREART